jgi:hypothetical protein
MDTRDSCDCSTQNEVHSSNPAQPEQIRLRGSLPHYQPLRQISPIGVQVKPRSDYACQHLGVVADFGRSSLPRRTSRPAATCVHVNQGAGAISCWLLHAAFALRRNSFPAERTYIDNHPRPHPRDMAETRGPAPHLFVAEPQKRLNELQNIALRKLAVRPSITEHAP